MPPTIDTPRLHLRPHQLSDFPDCCALWGNPDVTRHIRPQPFTAEEVWSRLLRYAGHWSLLGFGFWVVTDKSSGAFLGEVGFLNLHRDIEPPLELAPEVGWVFAPNAQGNGYATEAVQAALAWGDEHFGQVRMNCIITAENTASIRVAEKCGFGNPQPIIYLGEPLLLFGRGPAAS